jgi:hypothetical protein
MWGEQIDPMKITIPYNNKELKNRIEFLHEQINILSYEIINIL